MTKPSNGPRKRRIPGLGLIQDLKRYLRMRRM